MTFVAVLPGATATEATSIVSTVDDQHDHEHLTTAADIPEPAFDVVYDMIFPIVGGVPFGDNFGACRGTNCSRRHAGIDMMAPKMTPLVAVADGTVGWQHTAPFGEDRPCCAMALKHDDGWESYYIHMNNDTPGTDDQLGWGFAEGISTGVHVRAGQLIGWVGDSGNAENTGSHLHYELHQPDGDGGYTVINPYSSLLAATIVNAPVVEVDVRGCDFDRDGYHDLVVGSPGEDMGAGGAKTDVGGVTVLYGTSSGLTTTGAQRWHYKSQGVTGGLQAGARFGAATACGDFDGDTYDDLVIGAPGRDRNSKTDTGAVTILYGTPAGLQGFGDNLFDMGSPGVREGPTPGAGFGTVLVSGDFDGDGYDDIAVGAPDKARAGEPGAGIVIALLGSPNGIDGTSTLLFDGMGGLADAPEAGDGFGSAMAVADFDQDGRDDLAIGIPGEHNDGITGSGEVVIVPGGPDVFDKARGRRFRAPKAGWVDTANSAFGSAITTGDLNGDGIADLVVAAPGDSAGGTDAGTVRVFNGGGTKLVRRGGSTEISRASAGIAGTPASGEMFGASLTSDDFDADGYDDLAVGVPFATVGGSAAGAGVVVTVNGSSTGVRTSTGEVLHQNNLSGPWSASQDTWLGSFLSSGDYADAGVASLAIGVPGQDVEGADAAGAVLVVYGRPGGLDASDVDTMRESRAGIPGTSEAGDAWSALDSPSG
jgi:hypothetical protein